MTLSKKYLSTVALALLCAAVFPSCKGDDKKDQPTPPAVEEKSLIASLTVTVENLSDPTRDYFYTIQYSYDAADRLSSATVSGDYNEDWSFTYGDGTITIARNSDIEVFLTNANGYIVSDKTGDYSASYDAEGHLLQLHLGDDESRTFKWKGDLLTEAQYSYSRSNTSTNTTIIYSKTKDPTWGLITLGALVSPETSMPAMWFGNTPACLPSKVIDHTTYSEQISEVTTTYNYTFDAKGRPVKIAGTSYEQNKGKNPLPDCKVVVTFTITYK